MKVLVINLGATSSKIGIYDENGIVSAKNLSHDKDKVLIMTANAQVEERVILIREWLQEIGIDLKDISAVALRSASLKGRVVSGVYLVQGDLERELIERYAPEEMNAHGSILGYPVIQKLFEGQKIPVYVVDPATVNEMIPEAIMTGHPLFERTPLFHALNHKEVGRRVAEQLDRKYEELNLVIVHMGGGISVAAHRRGQVIDVNNCSWDDGPFAAERSGTLPARKLVDLCFSGKYEKTEVLQMLKGKGGLMAHLGTPDLRLVEERIENGDLHAEKVYNGMIYHLVKTIGGYCAVLGNELDAIILTGGMVHSRRLADDVRERIDYLAPVILYPGEFENEALAAGVFRVLSGKEKIKYYALS